MIKNFDELKGAIVSVDNKIDDVLLSDAVQKLAYTLAIQKYTGASVNVIGMISVPDDDWETEEEYHHAIFEYACAVTVYIKDDIYACEDDFESDYGFIYANNEEVNEAYESVKEVYEDAFNTFINRGKNEITYQIGNGNDTSDFAIKQVQSTFLPYDVAKSFIQSLNLKTKEEYYDWWDIHKPSILPRDPDVYYN